MRRPSEIVAARQSAKMQERTAATAERLLALINAAPGARHEDLKYLAIHHASAVPALLRVLSATIR